MKSLHLLFTREKLELSLKDPVLSIMHCALKKSAAIFLMLKNPVGLIALCNLFASAMSVVKRLFMYIIIRQHLRTYFKRASLKRPEARDVIISFYAIDCLPREKQNPEKQ